VTDKTIALCNDVATVLQSAMDAPESEQWTSLRDELAQGLRRVGDRLTPDILASRYINTWGQAGALDTSE
jgi:hypothetical protein